MITPRIEKLLNEQYHMEVFSAHLYLAMCSHFMDQDLDGFAHFFRLQADEEQAHARKQFDYIHEVDGKLTIGQIDAPQTTFGTMREAFELALEHEQKVTKSINSIVKATFEEDDFATQNFLQWFIQEQVEEEASMRSIIAKVKLAEGNNSAIYLLNEELQNRVAEA
ncbi:MAG: ferritin [Bacteroidia bacterium]